MIGYTSSQKAAIFGMLIGVIGFAVSAPLAEAGAIYSDANDGFLEVRDNLPPQSPWPAVHGETFGGWNANVGEWFGPGLTTIVLPFELPNFGAVTAPFLTADFGVNLFEMGNSTVTDVDLYAVRVDPSPAISADDWYNGASPDPSATLLQDSFLTPASTTAGPGPNNFTDASGDSALLSYLNDAYGGGSGAGQFVFLRLSYGSDTLASGWDAYKITVAEAAGGEPDYPVISYTSSVDPVPEPASAALFAIGMGVLSTTFRRRR